MRLSSVGCPTLSRPCSRAVAGWRRDTLSGCPDAIHTSSLASNQVHRRPRSRRPGVVSRGSITPISSAMIPRRRGSPRARWPRSTRRMRQSRVAAPPGRARAATPAGRRSSKTRRRRDGAGRRDRSPRGRSPDASTRREPSGLGTHRFAPAARTAGRAPRRRSAARLRSDSPLSIASRRVPATRPARWSGRGSETSVGRPRRPSRTPSSASWSLVGSAATPSVRSRRSSRPTSTGSPGRSPGIPSSWPPRGSSRRISTGGGLPGGIASWSGTPQAHRRAAQPKAGAGASPFEGRNPPNAAIAPR